MEAIWEIIAPYVGMVIGAGGGGTIIYIVLRLLLGKTLKTNMASLEGMFNTEALSQKFADRLAGKTLNIDVTAVTEKALRKLSKQLDDKISTVADTTNSYKHLLVLMAGALSKFKALSKEEQMELAGAISALESGYVAPDASETMTVILEPISLDGEATAAVKTGGANFEGIV